MRARDTMRLAFIPAACCVVSWAAAYHPSCRNRVGASVSVPLPIFDGDANDWTPAPACQALAQSAAAAGKVVSITTYPSAAADAQTQTLDFLRRYLD